MRFDILNRLGVDHECDERTDGQTELPLATARSNNKNSNLFDYTYGRTQLIADTDKLHSQ